MLWKYWTHINLRYFIFPLYFAYFVSKHLYILIQLLPPRNWTIIIVLLLSFLYIYFSLIQNIHTIGTTHKMVLLGVVEGKNNGKKYCEAKTFRSPYTSLKFFLDIYLNSLGSVSCTFIVHHTWLFLVGIVNSIKLNRIMLYHIILF